MLMRKKLLMILTTSLILGHSAFVHAQDWSLPLDRGALRQLSPEALDTYNKAWEQIDRISYDIGVALLNRAAAQDPGNKRLQFYTVDRALNRANVYYSAGSYRDISDDFFNDDLRRGVQAPWLIDEIFIEGTLNVYTTPPWRISEAFLDLAEAGLGRLVSLDNLTEEERSRLNRMRRDASELRSTITERDSSRREAARPVVEHIFRQRREAFFRDADPIDPKNPFDVEFDAVIQGIREIEALEDGALAETEYNPFARLPGEHLDPVFPPIPTFNQGFGQGFGGPGFGGPMGGMDEWGNPIGGGPAFGPPMGGPPLDPFSAAPQPGVAPGAPPQPNDPFLF
jgi:hypothetical protein